MAHSSTCSPPMAKVGLVDGSSPPRSWFQMVRNLNNLWWPLPSTIAATIAHFLHISASAIAIVAQKQGFWGENKHTDGLFQTIGGNGNATMDPHRCQTPRGCRIFSVFHACGCFSKFLRLDLCDCTSWPKSNKVPQE